MSINETGAECHNCGSYNCDYLCTECVLTLLLECGLSLESALLKLKEQDIELESWEIDSAKASILKKET